MNARELRAKGDEELRKELVDLHREAFKSEDAEGNGAIVAAKPGQEGATGHRPTEYDPD